MPRRKSLMTIIRDLVQEVRSAMQSLLGSVSEILSNHRARFAPLLELKLSER